MLLPSQAMLPGDPQGAREQPNRERAELVQQRSYSPSWIIRPMAA